MSSDKPISEMEAVESEEVKKAPGWLARSLRPFRTATLRGLAIILPPLLTIIFFFWAWNVIDVYLVRPVESAVINSVAYCIKETYNDRQIAQKIESGEFHRRNNMVISADGNEWIALRNGQWIPAHVHDSAASHFSDSPLVSADDYYRHHVKTHHVKRHLFIPAFLALFLVVLYLLGKMLAVGIGRIAWHYFERLITQLPIVRNVYSSVKQVTDFALSENEMTFTRIVAVEYPRKGVWSVGFVTSEGMAEIRDAAGEPILTVLMPTSPMPATGFTISVRKSETIDLNITIDQAIQFCVSCGVVIPAHQQSRNMIEGAVQKQMQQAIGTVDTPTKSLNLDGVANPS